MQGCAVYALCGCARGYVFGVGTWGATAGGATAGTPPSPLSPHLTSGGGSRLQQFLGPVVHLCGSRGGGDMCMRVCACVYGGMGAAREHTGRQDAGLCVYVCVCVCVRVSEKEGDIPAHTHHPPTHPPSLPPSLPAPTCARGS